MSEPTVKATDNDSIPLVGRYAEGPTRAVDTQGEFAYFGTGEYLTVADISNPSNPAEVGRVLLPAQPWDIEVHGDYAYVAEAHAGLAIIDVSDPTAPEIEAGFASPYSFLPLTGNAVSDVAVAGDYLYYTSGYEGMLIIDISNPESPEYINTFGDFEIEGETDEAYARGVAVSGGYAYVIAGDGLHVIDVSNSSNPRKIAYFDSGNYGQGRSTDLTIEESWAFVSGGLDGLKVLDISNPADPQEISSFNPSGIAVRRVAVKEDYAYVRDRVVDVSDPANPHQIATLGTDGKDISISEKYAYATTGTSGLRVIDISDPASPESAGSFPADDFVHHAAFSGDYAYAATGNLTKKGNGGLKIIDVSNPKNHRESAFLPIDGIIEEVVIDENRAYVGSKIIDISNPKDPKIISESPGIYRGASVEEEILYSVSGGDLVITDMSDIEDPKEISRIQIEEGNTQVRGNLVVYGEKVYVSEDEKKVSVVDVSSKSNPKIINTIKYSGGPVNDMKISGGYMYLSTRFSVLIFDISNDKNPKKVSRISRRGFNITKGIDVAGGYAYLADGYAGLRALNISDPSDPQLVGTSRGTFTSISNVELYNEYLFAISDYNTRSKGGVYVFSHIGDSKVLSPTITDVNPDSIVGSEEPQSITIKGTNFRPESSVRLRNKRTGEVFPDRKLIDQTGTHLTVKHDFGTESADWSAEVINPGADKSGEFGFEVLPAGTGQTPAAPTDLAASAENGAIQLMWNASTSEYVEETFLYRSVDASEGGKTLIDTLDGGATSYVDTTIEAGTQYSYRLRVRNAAGNMSPFSSGVSAFFKPSSLTYDLSRNFNGADETTDYRLVALPGQISQPFSEMVSGKAGVEWQAFWDNGSAENYLIKQDGSATFTFQPGRGFWMLKKSNWSVSQSVETVPLSGKESTSIPLHDGWNIISNPFGKDVSWAQVDAAHSESLRALWHFDGSFADADTFRSARTGEAFYFLNDTSLDSLNVPYVKDSVASKQAVRKSHEEDKSGGASKGSLVTIRARPKNGTGPTSAVKVGFDENAAEGLGRLDEPAPPGRFSGLSLRLRLPGDAQPRRRSLMTERRPPTDGSEEGHTFDLRLQATTVGPIQIMSDGLSAIGNDEAKLLRASTGRSYDLAEGEPVTIEDADSTGLKLAIGSASYVEEQAEQVVPDEVSLTSYPNPTRGQATVEYTLPEAKKVTLEVYDVLGRRVATLEQGRKEAGRHTAEFSGMRLSSGIYFGRLRAGGQTRTQKITVVR